MSKTGLGLFLCLVAVGLALMCGCAAKPGTPPASIQITRVPQSDSAGGSQTEVIQGTAFGASNEDRVVLYARTGTWWVQPLEGEPLTTLDDHLNWINGTHLGTDYAALLVSPAFVPPANLRDLPSIGGLVKAVAVAHGQDRPPSRYIAFSGYQWRTRIAPSNRGGSRNDYSAQNAWTDPNGALHLEITGGPAKWTCAEIALTQSLGYGTYILHVRDVSKLESSVVLAFFTYDYAAGDENHREVNIEVSRWGNPSIKNGQYIVQPFNVPTNVSRFLVPPGPAIHTLQWEPSRMKFTSATNSGSVFSSHVFTSGTPSPGLESPRIALYYFKDGPHALTHPAEAIIDKFTYLP